MDTLELTAELVPEEEGGFSVYCPELDIYTQGETEEECEANLREAAELVLEEAGRSGCRIVIRSETCRRALSGRLSPVAKAPDAETTARRAAIRLYVLGCLVADLLPRLGPPDLPYRGADQDRIVLNFGCPYTFFLLDPDPRFGFQGGIAPFGILPLQAFLAVPAIVAIRFGMHLHAELVRERSSANAVLRVLRSRFGSRVVVVLAFLCLLVFSRRAIEGNMLEVTREWGRLAPLPISARGFVIRTEGNPFTRSFRARFSAPLPDIEAWLANSPGPRETVLDPTESEWTRERGRSYRLPENVRKYVVDPGGGAQWGEVVVDESDGTVSIYVYWS